MKRTHSSRALRLVLVSTLASGAATTADSATYTSARSGNWSDPATWSSAPPAGSPADNDDVFITAGHTITYDQGAPGTVRSITLAAGSRTTLVMARDLEVNALLWVRHGATLDLGTFNMSGGILRLGMTSENAALRRADGSRIRVTTWEHYRTNMTMDKGDRIQNLYLTNSNGAVTKFRTASRFNISSSVWVERGGVGGTTTLELGDDLVLTGDLSMREAILDDNGYNVTVVGLVTNGNRSLANWNGMALVREGGNLVAGRMVFGRDATQLSFRSCDIVLDQFKTVSHYRRFPDVDITQFPPDRTTDGQQHFIRSTAGLTMDNPAPEAFQLGRNSASDQTEITLNWDESPLAPGCDWILRWRGDHVDTLRGYVDNRQLIPGTLPLGQRSESLDLKGLIFYDGNRDCSDLDYTYVAFKSPPPNRPPALPGLTVGRTAVYKTEGPTDYGTHLRPEGTVPALMVFVDFPDLRGVKDTASIGNYLLGHGQAQLLFRTQSYGRMQLAVTMAGPWRTMPKKVAGYVQEIPQPDGTTRQEFDYELYGNDAASLFREYDFNTYKLFFIVPPEAFFPFSPAHIFTVAAPRGSLRHVVTFGTDSYTNRFTNLVHETAHQFGLPDLYTDAPVPNLYPDAYNPVGPWDLMDMINPATGFFGWHRHKMGWLDLGRKVYLGRRGEWVGVLTPLSSCCGVSMVAIPAVKGSRSVSRVFLVELAQPVLTAVSGPDPPTPYWAEEEMSKSEGVLVYSINARIATGSGPGRVYSKSPLTKWQDHWQDPYRAGETFSSAEAPMTIEVLEKIGAGPNASYKVRIAVK